LKVAVTIAVLDEKNYFRQFENTKNYAGVFHLNKVRKKERKKEMPTVAQSSSDIFGNKGRAGFSGKLALMSGIVLAASALETSGATTELFGLLPR